MPMIQFQREGLWTKGISNFILGFYTRGKVDCNSIPSGSRDHTLTVEWKNSDNFYPESLGDYLHYGIGFVNPILLSDQLGAENQPFVV